MKHLLPLLLLISFQVRAMDCRQDAEKFCPGTEPGKGQLAKCLEDHSTQLSPACAKELKEFDKKTSKINPCHKDLADYCADVEAVPGKIEYCLLKHESRLSPTCAADFKSKKTRILAGNLCAPDVVANCYGELGAPEGAITKCLIKNRSKLSVPCGGELDARVASMRKKNACFDETQKFCPTQVKFIDIQDCLEKKIKVLTPDCKKLVLTVQDRANANPCYRDLMRHCRPNIGPDDQERCLTVNDKDVSNSCKQFRVNEQDKVQKMVKLCEKDRMKLCASAPLKDGAVVKCLREKKEQLSVECKGLM